MTQIQQIKKILSDGKKHCSVEFSEKYMVDYRRRISDIREEINKLGFTISSEPCGGRCGRVHNSGVCRYWVSKI